MEKIKVLVVDDSAFMRKVIADMLVSDPQIEVIGTARNGLDALEKIKQKKPDLITLDLEMPKMNGLEFLEKLMVENPLPVIMISSLTHAGTDATIKALSLGAVDFIPKPSGSISLDIEKIKNDLLNKVKVGAKINLSRVNPNLAVKFKPSPPLPSPVKSDSIKVGGEVQTIEPINKVKIEAKPPQIKPISSFPRTNIQRIVAIGTSTGGPRALQEVIPKLPADLPAAVLIIQHMPKGFTHSLAERLNQQSKIRVKEGQFGDRLENGLAILAPGGYHMTLEKGGVIGLNQDAPVWGVRPAVDLLLESIAKNYSGQVLSVILTGMGHDGAEGVAMLKELGGKAIAEDKSTCVVYGMPKSVVDKGLADKILPLHQIAEGITQLLQAK